MTLDVLGTRRQNTGKDKAVDFIAPEEVTCSGVGNGLRLIGGTGDDRRLSSPPSTSFETICLFIMK
jgi:hypothetical protein